MAGTWARHRVSYTAFPSEKGDRDSLLKMTSDERGNQ
jgi:hypothetical protein